MKTLHQSTIDYIRQFARDHFINLRGIDRETRDWEESITSVNWSQGGFNSQSHEVEKVTFTPEHFSFNYKGATISGPLQGVSVETRVLINGEEADCEQDDIEAAVEKACGFPTFAPPLRIRSQAQTRSGRATFYTRRFRSCLL